MNASAGGHTTLGVNANERLVYEALTARQFTVLRGGWPDFLVIGDDSGETFAVEVKAGSDTTKPHQADMQWYLLEAGIPTLTFRVTQGLIVPWSDGWLRSLRTLDQTERAAIAQLCGDRRLHPQHATP